MSWHLAAFTGSIGATARTQVNAANDDILRIDQTNGFMMPFDTMLLFAYAQSALLLRSQLESPKILQTNPLFIRPVNTGATPVLNPSVAWWGPNYLFLRGQEDILAYVSNSAAGPSQSTILIAVSPILDPMPAGQIYTVYATSTTAAVANTWTSLTYTMQTGLPAGTYAMVGSNVSSTTAIGHRWIFSNQIWRPGFVSNTLETDKPSWLQVQRVLGPMGQFYQYDLPRLQVFAGAADAAHQIYMDLIKVA